MKESEEKNESKNWDQRKWQGGCAVKMGNVIGGVSLEGKFKSFLWYLFSLNDT